MGRKKKEETGIALPQQANVPQVGTFIEKALAANASIETMERLFALQKEVFAEQARGAFTQALANFQRLCPEIKKDRVVNGKDGKERYKFAGLDIITRQIRDPLAQEGLSYSWDVEKHEGNMVVTVTITHVLGHSTQSSFEIPIDTNQYMTEPQRYASAVTFAKRYTLTNALGITTAEEDTDATDVRPQKNAKSVKARIMLALKALGYEVTELPVIEENVKKLTQLDLKEENLDEIAERLDALVVEKQEYDRQNAGA